MLYFYVKMHENVFGGRAVPGPDVEVYCTPPHPLAGLKGMEGGRTRWREGQDEKEGGGETGRKERGRTLQSLKCIGAPGLNTCVMYIRA